MHRRHMGNVVTAQTSSTTKAGRELLAVVARLNRLATQRIQMPLPAAQARLLATIEVHGEARSVTWPRWITARSRR